MTFAIFVRMKTISNACKLCTRIIPARKFCSSSVSLQNIIAAEGLRQSSILLNGSVSGVLVLVNNRKEIFNTKAFSNTSNINSNMVLRSPQPDIIIPNVSFHEYILKSMYDRGDGIAIIDAPTGRQFTFKQFADEVVKCASALNGAGLRKGDIIATCAPNSPEYIIITIAAAACGAITTTCNPNYTLYELQQQFDSSEPKFVFTVPEQYKKIKDVAEIVKSISEIYVIGEFDGVNSYSNLLENGKNSEFPHVIIDPEEDVMLLPYSSGTTGMPKGVMITHKNIVAGCLLSRMAAMYPSDCKYTPLPLFHLLGIISAYTGLDQGVKHVLETRFDLKRFFSDIEKYKVTQVVGVPPMFLAMVKSPLIDKYDFSSVRNVFCGAASLPPQIANTLKKKFGCHVMQVWGLTEAAPIAQNDVIVTPLQSVGSVYVTTKLKVIDIVSGKELGPLQNGELCVKGPQVMKGYYKNPSATNNAIDTDGWMHTGDIGYYDRDEMIYIVGRLKELIKYKGFQVAPAEVESVLLGHPGISDAAVVGITDVQAGELPKGFIVKKDDSLTKEDVHTYLEGKLIKYKQLHGGIEFCDSIPKNSAGKILRRVLMEKTTEKL